MKAHTRWMSFDMFRLSLSYYPGSKVGLATMTEEQFATLGWVRDTRIRHGKREYLLDLGWAFRITPTELFRQG